MVLLNLHHSDHFSHARLPIREQVDILDALGDASRHGAAVESDGDEKDLIQRHPGGANKRVTKFAVKAAAFTRGPARKTSDKEIRSLNGRLDCARPVLPRHQFLFVEPGTKSILLESGI